MFTINQIKEAHSKVKSGADFPAYVQALKSLGVKSYEHFVADGHMQYLGSENFILYADAKWPPKEISEIASIETLKNELLVHQQGKTDYPTFCKQAAETGVEKWVVDMKTMTCIYYDKKGKEMLSEAIPTPPNPGL